MTEDALRESGDNKQKAAHTLGLSRQGVSMKIKRLRIQAEECLSPSSVQGAFLLWKDLFPYLVRDRAF